MNRRRAFRATVGSGADLAVRQGTQFVFAVVLARLLTPAEFGTVALLGTFLAVGTVIADAGITVAILQRPIVDDAELSAAFWLSVCLGATVTAAAAGITFVVAHVFGLDQYAGLGAFMALGIFGTALGQTHAALLVKRRSFRHLLIVGLVGALGAGVLAVWLASRGAGVLAIGAQAVAMPVIMAALLLSTNVFSLSRHFDAQDMRKLLTEGRWITAATLVDVAYQRAQYAVIGGVFGSAALGRYQRADTTTQITNDTTSTVMGRVALPLLAESAGRQDLVHVGYRTGVRNTVAFSAPAMALLAALAAPFLTVVFGDQWTSAAPLLSALAIAGMLWPLHVMAITSLYAAGANRFVFRIDLVKKAAGACLLMAGIPFGLNGVALAQVAIGLVVLTVNAWAVEQKIGLSVRRQIDPAVKPVAVAAVVGLLVAVGSSALDRPAAQVLVGLGLLGGMLYLALALAVRVEGVREVLGLLRSSLWDSR